MRGSMNWALAVATAITLTACHRGPSGGGGGQAQKIDNNGQPVANVPNTQRAPNAESYDSSNPTTREEYNTHALPLRAVPNQPNAVNGVGITGHSTTRVTLNGQPAFRIDVNHASPAQLMRIPGVGLNLADAIVSHRPYHNAQDLARKVPDLDRRRVASFEPYLAFGSAQARR